MTKSELDVNSVQWPWDDSCDAVIAAPRSHVIKLENDSVRVVEVIIPPGQKEPIHTHRWPSVMIVSSSAKIRYYDAGGIATEIPRRNVNANNPYVEWLDPEGLHAVENIDTIPYRALRVELKKSPPTVAW